MRVELFASAFQEQHFQHSGWKQMADFPWDKAFILQSCEVPR